MRLCYININAESTSRSSLDLAARLFAQVARSDTRVEIRSVESGLTRASDVRYAYFSFLNTHRIVESIVDAEDDGFDAVTVGCFFDPGVREARGAVDIPVVGMGEASLHLACQMGDRLGIVTTRDPAVHAQIREHVRRLGLEPRMAPEYIRSIDMSFAKLYTAGLRDPPAVADTVVASADACVAGGADVVVIGCNALAPACTLGGAFRTQLRAAPIVDCVTAAVKTAEALVDLRRIGGLAVSRAGAHVRPSDAEMARVRKQFGLRSRGPRSPGTP